MSKLSLVESEYLTSYNRQRAKELKEKQGQSLQNHQAEADPKPFVDLVGQDSIEHIK
ncbi:MAG: hypothetical protein IPP25_17640 [Saprospiraceae bacterium]|nr:hypothetical protein [Candidatus Opimibacter skivensis]